MRTSYGALLLVFFLSGALSNAANAATLRFDYSGRIQLVFGLTFYTDGTSSSSGNGPIDTLGFAQGDLISGHFEVDTDKIGQNGAGTYRDLLEIRFSELSYDHRTLMSPTGSFNPSETTASAYLNQVFASPATNVASRSDVLQVFLFAPQESEKSLLTDSDLLMLELTDLSGYDNTHFSFMRNDWMVSGPVSRTHLRIISSIESLAVTLVSTVPEPSTALLMGLGLAGLSVRRR